MDLLVDGHHCAFGGVITGLRLWPLGRYPPLVPYIERAQHIDAWRVLHKQRDIPAWMQASETI